MKILLIDYDAGTVSLGGDTHAYDLAKEWKKSGGKVLIAAADYSYLRQKNPEKPQIGKIEEQDGVPFLWIKSPAAADREKKILHGTLPFEKGLSAQYGTYFRLEARCDFALLPPSFGQPRSSENRQKTGYPFSV